MDKYQLTRGEGRTKVTLSAPYMGSHLGNITSEEIDKILQNTTSLADEFISQLD